MVISELCMDILYSIFLLLTDYPAVSGAFFGQGSGPILLSNVRCRYRFQGSLLDCAWSASGLATCTHAKDAGVCCKGLTDICGDHTGAVRLTGTSSAMYGAAEVCINGTWGSICSENWDNRDASVVCRELGYSPYGTFVVACMCL